MENCLHLICIWTTDGQLNSSKMQQQSPTQAIQPASNTPIGTVSKGGTSALYHLGWQQALLAVGLLAISGAGTALVFKVVFQWIK